MIPSMDTPERLMSAGLHRGGGGVLLADDERYRTDSPETLAL